MRTLVWSIASLALVASACNSEQVPIDCASTASSYAAAMKDAVVCDVLVANSCSATRAAALQDACQCQVTVNPLRTAELDQLAAFFSAQGCPPSQPTCSGTCPVLARSCLAVPGAASTCTGP